MEKTPRVIHFERFTSHRYLNNVNVEKKIVKRLFAVIFVQTVVPQ